MALEIESAADVLDDFCIRVDAAQTFDLSSEIIALLGAADPGIDDNGCIRGSAQIGVNVKQTLSCGVADGGDDSVVGIAAQRVGM